MAMQSLLFSPATCLPWMVAVGLLLVGPARAADAPLDVRLPAGFRITQFAGDRLVHNLYSLTFDPAGRVVVSGPGFIRTLLDLDQDGSADSSIDFSSQVESGAQGLCFGDSRLLATTDHGLWCWTDADGDAVADGPPEKWLDLNHGEHGAHAIRQGPDGWIYLLCGNDSGLTGRVLDAASSPIDDPESGCLLRISPDGRIRQCVADGFRNPYDLDFHPSGAVLTVDSDGERDQHLPWYVPTRLFDIGRGAHHGWIFQGWTQSWSRPGYFPDSVPPLATFGRGSPTGLVVYRHRAFPERYRSAIFTACWSLGRIYAVRLTRDGDTLRAEVETFLQPEGTSGFAPVDLEVGPQGDLWVAIGGRGTQGGVYRIAYQGADHPAAAERLTRVDGPRREEEDRKAPLEPPSAGLLDAILDAPQPLAAWSRAQWLPQARAMPRAALVAAAADVRRPWPQRVRAVEILVETGGLTRDDVDPLSVDGEPHVLARSAWALGRSPEAHATIQLAYWARHPDPWVARAACEALVGRTVSVATAGRRRYPLRYRRLRQAQLRAAPVGALLADSRKAADGLALLDAAWRRWAPELRGAPDEPPADSAAPLLELAAGFPLHRGPDGRWARLEILRLLQLALGDIQVEPQRPDQALGYSARNLWFTSHERQTVSQLLLTPFPTGDADVDAEIVRTLAMLRAPDTGSIRKVGEWIRDQDSPEALLHGLMALSQLPGPRSAEDTRWTAEAIARLHPLMRRDEKSPSRNWMPHVERTVRELCRQDARLAEAIVAHPDFRLPEQASLIGALPLDDQAQATRQLMQRIPYAEDWSAELVQHVFALPEGEGVERVRWLWDRQIHQDLAATLLARSPAAEDRHRLLASLASPDPEVVRQCALALEGLPPVTDAEALVPLWHAVGRYDDQPSDDAVVQALIALCHGWMGLDLEAFSDLGSIRKALAQRYPEWDELPAAGGAKNWPQWQARLAAINWSLGRREQGQQIFERLSCHTCHLQQGRLGPELEGVAQRLARDDLFRAILYPQDQVSPAYRLVQVETEGGRVYHGMPVYESPDATLLQVGAQEVVRIAGERIVSTEPSPQSLMPSGLLDRLDDQELADFYAYLRELK